MSKLTTKWIEDAAVTPPKISQFNAGSTSEKTSIDLADRVLINDSADSYNHKFLQLMRMFPGALLFADLTKCWFWDDFYGDRLIEPWDTEFVGSGSVLAQEADGGQVKLRTGAITNDSSILSFGVYHCFLCTQNIDYNFAAKLDHTSGSLIKLGMAEDWIADYHYFEQDDTGNLWAKSMDTSTPETTDCGETLGTAMKRFRIVTSSSNVKFYINGSLKATHTTVSDERLSPYNYIKTQAAANKRAYLDYVGFTHDRGY